MRVGITVGRSPRGGIARYARELFLAIHARDDVQVVPIGSAAAIAALGRRQEGAAIVIPTTNQLGDSLYVRYALGLKAAHLGLDLIHATRHLIPRRAPCPSLLTVYDLFALERKEEFSLAKRLLLPRWFSQSLNQADALLCISDATLQRLRLASPSLVAKATTVHCAVPTGLLAAAPRRPEGMSSKRFALVVGDLSPRKNVAFLLHMWPTIFSATGLRLVVAGSDGWRSEATVRLVNELVASGCLTRFEQVPDPELRWLYETAQMVLCPSLAEGWGFSVTEGLAFGTPVIASNDPAHSEAAAGQALLLNPARSTDWQAAITDLALRGAKSLKRTGVRGARTWSDVAADTVALYRTLVAA